MPRRMSAAICTRLLALEAFVYRRLCAWTIRGASFCAMTDCSSRGVSMSTRSLEMISRGRRPLKARQMARFPAFGMM